MREISPAVGVSVEDYLKLAPEIKPLITGIRRQKEVGERLRPSTSLIDRSQMLTEESRGKLLSKQVGASPYWGLIAAMPSDRRLRENHGAGLPTDVDVDGIWWPELKAWIDETLLR